ncbi:MAG: DUF4446 family protein [bacterium]|nr:DUF4446 family protein [bacterium]
MSFAGTTIDPLIVISILGGLVIILLFWVIRLELRLKKFLVGPNARSFEDSVTNIRKELEHLGAFQKDALGYFQDVEKRLRSAIQSVHTVRFNPFKGTGSGGNQSFSTAFVNEEGNGVILSSLYSRDRVSVFSKPLKQFASEHELTDEEQEVLVRAKSALE